VWDALQSTRDPGPETSVESRIELEILAQPDDSTCGPTCLHAVYRFYGRERPLDSIIREIPTLETGGTLAVQLACHALRSGYAATIYTYNLNLFDPTWFDKGVDIAAKLRAQCEVKADPRLRVASNPYLQFLALGGELAFVELTPALLRRHLKAGRPLLTGLSATYLYGCAREHDDVADDIAGAPVGHFVVLCGYDPGPREVLVADPLHDNPRTGSPYYRVGIQRLMGAILLGIVTHDANLVVLEPLSPGHDASRH
jgi:hypothetical protein